MSITTLTLPARCDRSAADALLPQLQAAVAAGEVAVDGTTVAHFGQAMLQLLLSARLTLARRGIAMTVTASPAMRDMLELVDAERLTDGGTKR